MAKNVSVLVVDDDLAVLESFKMILGIKDYEVTTAKNMEEAAQAAGEKSFDLAFIDLRFYGKDIGLDILSKLKEVDPALPAVICTAFATEKSKLEAIQRGAMDYINKPFMMEAIYDLVDRALALRKERR